MGRNDSSPTTPEIGVPATNGSPGVGHTFTAMSLPRHKDDFGRVYDLEDPSPYFNALAPSGYRMPEVLARALKAIHGAVCAARDAPGTLRVLVFACGYGAVGALVCHDVSMAELYARYAKRSWQPDEGRRYWAGDARFFAARREKPGRFEFGGLDIDWTPLDALWTARGYRAESLGREPVGYRKPLGELEKTDVPRATRALGKTDDAVMRGGYVLVDMTLARPEGDAGNTPHRAPARKLRLSRTASRLGYCPSAARWHPALGRQGTAATHVLGRER